MNDLVVGFGLAQPAVKAGQLQVQPLTESQMQRIPCPQRGRLRQTETGGYIEILGCQRQGVQALLMQHPEPPPGFLGLERRVRIAANLQNQS